MNVFPGVSPNLKWRKRSRAAVHAMNSDEQRMFLVSSSSVSSGLETMIFSMWDSSAYPGNDSVAWQGSVAGAVDGLEESV